MKKGFTLIELIVVIVIALMLIAIISPTCSKLTTGKTNDEMQIEGCQDPQFQQVVVTNEVYKTYIYTCNDGHIIELDNRI